MGTGLTTGGHTGDGRVTITDDPSKDGCPPSTPLVVAPRFYRVMLQ
jgi:hypothetical protein